MVKVKEGLCGYRKQTGFPREKAGGRNKLGD